MNEDEKYLFDLTGYLVLRDVLSAEELNEHERVVMEAPHIRRR